MTTDHHRGSYADWSRAAAIALAAWFCGVTALTLMLEPTELMVLAPGLQALAAALEAEAVILDGCDGVVRVRAETPGLVRRLYGSSAYLVWPALPGGCIGRRKGAA